MADVHIAFEVPIFLGQTVNVGVRAARIGNKSIKIEQQIEDSLTGEVLATAEIIYVVYDLRSQTSMRVPDDIREKIRAYEGEFE